jgi:hypothetical protein
MKKMMIIKIEGKAEIDEIETEMIGTEIETEKGDEEKIVTGMIEEMTEEEVNIVTEMIGEMIGEEVNIVTEMIDMQVIMT